MGVKKIDTIQSAQIATLEADIVELKNKLNLLVADIQNITSYANQVIADLNDMNDVIMAGYTAPSSPSSDGILQKIEDWFEAYEDHTEYREGHWLFSYLTNILAMCGDPLAHHHGTNTYPLCNTRYASPPWGGGGTGGTSNPGGTGQGGNTVHTQGSSDASVDGSYKGKEQMLNITTKSAKRAKKLARQTLNRLRK